MNTNVMVTCIKILLQIMMKWSCKVLLTNTKMISTCLLIFCPNILCNLFCSQFCAGTPQSLNPHKLHSSPARTYMRRRMRRGRGGESLKPHNLSQLGNRAAFCFRFFLPTCLLAVNTFPYIFSSWYNILIFDYKV